MLSYAGNLQGVCWQMHSFAGSLQGPSVENNRNCARMQKHTRPKTFNSFMVFEVLPPPFNAIVSLTNKMRDAQRR